MKKSQKLKYISCFLAATSLAIFCPSVFSSTTPPCSTKPESPDQSMRKSTIIPMRLLPPEKQAEVRKQSSVLALFGRHGTTESNSSEKTHTRGSKEFISSDLSNPEEVSQFRELRQYLGRVYTSPDDRCKQTACLLCVGDEGSPRPVSLKANFIDSLREQDFGELTGKSQKEYSKSPEFFGLLSDDNYRMPGGGETLGEVTNRVLMSIEKGLKKVAVPTFFCSSRGCIVALKKFISGLRFDIPIGSLPDQPIKDQIIELYTIPNYSMLMTRYYPLSHVIEFLEEEWYSTLVKQGFKPELHTPENQLYSPNEALNILRMIDPMNATIPQDQLFQKAQALSECMSPLPSPASSPVQQQLFSSPKRERKNSFSSQSSSSTASLAPYHPSDDDSIPYNLENDPIDHSSNISESSKQEKRRTSFSEKHTTVPSSPLQKSLSVSDFRGFRLPTDLPPNLAPVPTNHSSKPSSRMNSPVPDILSLPSPAPSPTQVSSISS